jgi:hypothetical protein
MSLSVLEKFDKEAPTRSIGLELAARKLQAGFQAGQLRRVVVRVLMQAEHQIKSRAREALQQRKGKLNQDTSNNAGVVSNDQSGTDPITAFKEMEEKNRIVDLQRKEEKAKAAENEFKRKLEKRDELVRLKKLVEVMDAHNGAASVSPQEAKILLKFRIKLSDWGSYLLGEDQLRITLTKVKDCTRGIDLTGVDDVSIDDKLSEYSSHMPNNNTSIVGTEMQEPLSPLVSRGQVMDKIHLKSAKVVKRSLLLPVPSPIKPFAKLAPPKLKAGQIDKIATEKLIPQKHNTMPSAKPGEFVISFHCKGEDVATETLQPNVNIIWGENLEDSSPSRPNSQRLFSRPNSQQSTSREVGDLDEPRSNTASTTVKAKWVTGSIGISGLTAASAYDFNFFVQKSIIVDSQFAGTGLYLGNAVKSRKTTAKSATEALKKSEKVEVISNFNVQTAYCRPSDPVIHHIECTQYGFGVVDFPCHLDGDLQGLNSADYLTIKEVLRSLPKLDAYAACRIRWWPADQWGSKITCHELQRIIIKNEVGVERSVENENNWKSVATLNGISSAHTDTIPLSDAVELFREEEIKKVLNSKVHNAYSGMLATGAGLSACYRIRSKNEAGWGAYSSVHQIPLEGRIRTATANSSRSSATSPAALYRVPISGDGPVKSNEENNAIISFPFSQNYHIGETLPVTSSLFVPRPHVAFTSSSDAAFGRIATGSPYEVNEVVRELLCVSPSMRNRSHEDDISKGKSKSEVKPRLVDQRARELPLGRDMEAKNYEAEYNSSSNYKDLNDISNVIESATANSAITEPDGALSYKEFVFADSEYDEERGEVKCHNDKLKGENVELENWLSRLAAANPMGIETDSDGDDCADAYQQLRQSKESDGYKSEEQEDSKIILQTKEGTMHGVKDMFFANSFQID